ISPRLATRTLESKGSGGMGRVESREVERRCAPAILARRPAGDEHDGAAGTLESKFDQPLAANGRQRNHAVSLQPLVRQHRCDTVRGYHARHAATENARLVLGDQRFAEFSNGRLEILRDGVTRAGSLEIDEFLPIVAQREGRWLLRDGPHRRKPTTRDTS